MQKQKSPEATKAVYPILRQIVNLIPSNCWISQSANWKLGLYHIRRNPCNGEFSPPLSRFLRDNLSRIFTKPLKTLDEKYFRPVPNALRTFFWRSPNHQKTPFFTLFDRHRRSSATAPPRAPVRSRDRDVPVVRLRTRAGPSVCRRPSASSAVR